MSELRLFDCDTHYYETEDCFTRYLPERSQSRIRWVSTDDGKRRLLIGDRLYTFIANPTFDPIAKPGALTEMFRALRAGTRPTTDDTGLMPPQPAFTSRDARLAEMDSQGVAACWMFPTLAVTVEELMVDDVDLTYTSLHAFNRWLDEEWGFAHQDRIYGVPLLSLVDPERAVEELDWVMERGARVIHIRPAPTFGRSPVDPIYDPFWSRVDVAGLVVAFHASDSGYSRLVASHWGEPERPPSHLMSPFQWVTSFGDRPVLDMVAALVLHNLFGKYPRIRVASIEMGALWVPYLLKWLGKAAGLGRRVTPPGGRFTSRPTDLFREHVYVSPYPEEDVVALAGLIGAERVLLGSDWPHAEGLAEPAEYLEGLNGLDDAAIRAISWENAAALVGGKP